LRFVWLLLLGLLIACDEGEDPITRTFSKSKKKNETNQQENPEEVVDSIPNIPQDGKNILSRASLGFDRFGGLKGSRFSLVNVVRDIDSDEFDEKKKYDYVVLSVEDSEDCRVTARREDLLFYYPLDCSDHDESFKSRYFDLGLTPDDLFTYGASQCKFEDRGVEPILDYSESRSFKVVCDTKDNPNLTKKATIIEAWYHPESIHPSGLVYLKYQNCSELPCTKEKVITVEEPATAAWLPDAPENFNKSDCPHPINHKRISRCGDLSCFDLSELSYDKDLKVCQCVAKLTNIPVVWYYLPADLINDGTAKTADLATHASETDCKADLEANSDCQQCFNDSHFQ